MDNSNKAEADELGFQILTAIRRIVRQVSMHSNAMSTNSGLTVPQLLCLRSISATPAEDCTLARLAEDVHLSRSTVSVIVQRLVTAGYVQRDRSSRDRRRLQLSLTDAGTRILQASPRPLQDRFLRRVGALPLDQQRELVLALEAVVTLMDAEDLDAAPMLVPGSKVSPNATKP